MLSELFCSGNPENPGHSSGQRVFSQVSLHLHNKECHCTWNSGCLPGGDYLVQRMLLRLNIRGKKTLSQPEESPLHSALVSVKSPSALAVGFENGRVNHLSGMIWVKFDPALGQKRGDGLLSSPPERCIHASQLLLLHS